MSIVFISQSDCRQAIHYGVEDYLVHYVRTYGSIVSLDLWAHELGITPFWVRRCAHNAERAGKLKLIRMQSVSGRPYRVEYIGKEEKA
jgi:hypothetical protein